jgi:hypothetical protein
MIVVASTLAAFAMDDPDIWGSWLINAEQIQASHPDVRYFAAIETDARGLEPFVPLLERMAEIDGCQWEFSLDDGRTEVTTANRLRHITLGQNLATDYALSHPDCTHLLFLAADLEPPADTLTKLLEIDHPIVGGHVPTYCLDGPKVESTYTNARDGNTVGFDTDLPVPATLWPPPDADVRVHMASAAFILIRRDLLRFVRWRWDLDAGMSDDPCLHYDAKTFHGIETLVRHDCVGQHHPESIPSIEQRGYDLTVHRNGPGRTPDPAWVDRLDR